MTITKVAAPRHSRDGAVTFNKDSWNSGIMEGKTPQEIFRVVTNVTTFRTPALSPHSKPNRQKLPQRNDAIAHLLSPELPLLVTLDSGTPDCLQEE